MHACMFFVVGPGWRRTPQSTYIGKRAFVSYVFVYSRIHTMHIYSLPLSLLHFLDMIFSFCLCFCKASSLSLSLGWHLFSSLTTVL